MMKRPSTFTLLFFGTGITSLYYFWQHQPGMQWVYLCLMVIFEKLDTKK